MLLFLFFIIFVRSKDDFGTKKSSEKKELTKSEKKETIKLNLRPIIGIVTQHVPPWNDLLNDQENSYITATFVKYLEASGARVV